MGNQSGPLAWFVSSTAWPIPATAPQALNKFNARVWPKLFYIIPFIGAILPTYALGQ